MLYEPNPIVLQHKIMSGGHIISKTPQPLHSPNMPSPWASKGSLDVPRPLEGRAYYIESRTPTRSSHEHLQRPQSARTRDGLSAAPIRPPRSLDSISDIRKPSIAHSLPPRPVHTSLGKYERDTRSGPASISREHDPLGETSSELGLSEYLTNRHHPGPPSPRSQPTPRPESPTHIFSSYSLPEAGQDESTPTAGDTWRSLFHVALSAAPLSVVILIYTVLVLIFSLCVAPFRLCITSMHTLSEQICSSLVPPLNLQRRCVYIAPVQGPPARSSLSSQAPLSSEEALEGQRSTGGLASPQPGTLIAIHLFAPLVSVPLALSAWVMIVGWGLSMMVSDSRAGDDRDERRLAQKLVDCWATWLNWGVEDASIHPHSNEQRGRSRARPEMIMSGAV